MLLIKRYEWNWTANLISFMVKYGTNAPCSQLLVYTYTYIGEQVSADARSSCIVFSFVFAKLINKFPLSKQKINKIN